VFPDIDKVRRLVQEAAHQELLPKFADVIRRQKADGSIVTTVDLAMQHTLQGQLARVWPTYAFLGEEMPDSEHRRLLANSESGLWCLDPLDGTSNFAAGIPYFAVSLALLIRGEAVLGIVYDPVRKECFTAKKGEGAWLNDTRLADTRPSPPLERSLTAVDFKRLPPDLAARLGSNPPYGSQRNFGACALDWCWLACDRFHLYLHGGQKIWDYAAGCLVLSEAGGHAQTLKGKPLAASDISPSSVIAAHSSALFEQWRRWLSEA